MGFREHGLQSKLYPGAPMENLRFDLALDETPSVLFLLRDTETEPCGEEVHVTVEAEMRVMKLQPERHLELPATQEAGERRGLGSAPELPEVPTTSISDLWPPEL